MKPNTDTSLRTEGTLGGKRKAMTIDANSLDRMTLMLTDLYSDKEGAVLREYPINGLDSHRAAGATRPVEVTLPSFSDPTFVVKDYGTGLSEFDVMEHFSRYGWSSKLETNDEVGMMGLGCKAALTYTKQFALTATKDGLATEVLVLRAIDEETGREIPSVEPVSVTPTDEPNGVTVYIPISNVDSFNHKARAFFAYWKPGDILVNGVQPEPPTGTWLDDDVLIQDCSESYRESGTTIVMGNIPYPVSREHWLGEGVFNRHNVHIVVWVPIGSVDPTPAREALADTPRTLETLRLADEFLRDRVLRDAQAQLDACETHTEAVSFFVSTNRQLAHHRHKLTYRGQGIPEYLQCPDPVWGYRPSSETARSGEWWTRQVSSAVKEVYVVGHTTKTVSRRQRDKIAGYLETLDKDDRHFLHYRELILLDNLRWANGWLDGARVIQWEDIEAAEALRIEAQKPERAERRYRVMTKDLGRRTVRESELPLDRHLVMASPRVENEDDFRSFRNAITASDFFVVMLHPRSFKRFKRDFPKALTPKQAVYRELRNMARSIALDELGTTGGDRTIRNNLALLAGEQVEDSELLRAANAVRRIDKDDLQARWMQLERAAIEVGLDFAYVAQLKTNTNKHNLQKLADRYPLLRLMQNGHVEARDFVEYVNLLYHARQESSP